MLPLAILCFNVIPLPVFCETILSENLVVTEQKCFAKYAMKFFTRIIY